MTKLFDNFSFFRNGLSKRSFFDKKKKITMFSKIHKDDTKSFSDWVPKIDRTFRADGSYGDVIGVYGSEIVSKHAIQLLPA